MRSGKPRASHRQTGGDSGVRHEGYRMKPDPTDTAIALMSKRGYVIAGYPTKAPWHPEIGTELDSWCNRPLIRHNLRVTAETDRADWDAQVKAIRTADWRPKNPRVAKGQRFFRCELRSV